MKSDLAQRMDRAADDIAEASAAYGYRNPNSVNWTADMLRREAQVLREESPE